ncbi:KpsF/GutQ family sugar-phosphate isomerase [Vibrio sp. CAU 1672]|uniref:KpsF/GutQ family sugar-phosphate isomerase n=1 Tax=Vibrio sp. CAU 1672 TaxID=3032594 RepID=UPI0023DB57C9|nr:KpsF/GutQ family sugar-phosphate isomerase [Vibrio sp. CAU 1672]MDF2155177.1 KpsF/GutQ family sugar-phosphate isomerase [Vibrio sp. CAU 1672]
MHKQYTTEDICQLGRGVIEQELDQARLLLGSLDASFVQACETILNCAGKVIITGIGKSGHISKKIAATFASTGSPAFFVHPAEALHGDLGMARQGDIVILISNSGEANEFKLMVPLLKRQNITTIGVTANLSSFLAKECDITLDIAAKKEACPLGLAPTASATNTLLLGDALGITVMTMRNFGHNDFALSHPAGALGSRLLTNVEHLLDEQHKSAFCSPNATLQDAVGVMCQTGYGLIAIAEQGSLQGVFTDGDLRRAFAKGVTPDTTINSLVKNGAVTIGQSSLCADALTLMSKHAITALPVLDDKGRFVGVINLHTIQKAGIY